MNYLFRILTALILAVSLRGFAAPYDAELFQIDVPSGFEGPLTQSPGPGAKLVGYTKPYPGSDGGTLLQITTYELQLGSEVIPEDQRAPAAERYLLQFLQGVERKRTSYKQSPPTHVSLGGKAAVRAEWSGVAEGRPMSGVMYCAVVGSTVIAFHTQDFDTAPADNRSAALQAIEGVRFTHGG